MSTKSALRAELDAEDRKTLAEDRKRMERLGKGSQLDDWLAFGPGLLIRRRLAKNIAGLAETDPAKGHRYSRAFKQQMEMDGLYDRRVADRRQLSLSNQVPGAKATDG